METLQRIFLRVKALAASFKDVDPADFLLRGRYPVSLILFDLIIK